MQYSLAERSRVIGRLGVSSFVVFHAPSVPPEAICATLCAHVGKPATVARLRSDAITADEGAFIHDALLQDRALVLISGGGNELPAALLKAWEYFRDDPRHSFTQADRHIRFRPEDLQVQSGHGDELLGTLMLVVPDDYHLKVEYRQWIHSTEELGDPAPPPDDIRELGRPAVTMSMKTLYYLHHRDPPEAEHRQYLGQIIEGERPLTWSDLRQVLQQQPDEHMLAILEGFRHEGRLSDAQLDLAAAAIPFIRRETGERVRIGVFNALAPSIYHALWSRERLLEGKGRVFRGQRDSRWRQDATLLRGDPDGNPPALETIVERLHRTQAFLEALAACEQDLIGRQLNDDERLAIAQHYGMPTALLDYTRSLGIAAFFATGSGDASVLKEGDVGVIYYMSPTELPVVPDATETSFDFPSAAGIRPGRLRTIEPQLPDAENRIARQKGLFFEGFDSRDLQRMSLGVVYFRQRAGEAFEDPRLGITRNRLLTPDAKLEQLASSITSHRPRLSKRLLAARIPGDNIIGALGISLPEVLSQSQDFLNEAARVTAQIAPELWLSIEAILTRHLNESRIKARTDDISASGTLTTVDEGDIVYILDEVDQSLEELAALADLRRDALMRLLRRHRPVLGPEMEPTPVDESIDLPSVEPKVRVVTAVAIFVVGLEYLRTVRGEMAIRYMEKAADALDPNRTA
jgi:hypothetical protein